ncbi:MAG: PAS domain-containing protein, partial [Oscillospiraceae bacterium]
MKNLSEIKSDFRDLSLPIGQMIVAANSEFEILFANDVFVKMLGFDDFDKFASEYDYSAWNFVLSDDKERLKAAADERMGKSEPYEISYRAVKKDGSLIWIDQNSTHSYDENGNEIIFAYYTDITKRKQMEEEILLGTKKYETLINSIPGGVGMYLWNDTFDLIFVSDGVYELCGMTKEEY